MTLGAPGCRLASIENPRVGGSIPPLATITNSLAQRVASEGVGSLSDIDAGAQYFGPLVTDQQINSLRLTGHRITRAAEARSVVLQPEIA